MLCSTCWRAGGSSLIHLTLVTSSIVVSHQNFLKNATHCDCLVVVFEAITLCWLGSFVFINALLMALLPFSVISDRYLAWNIWLFLSSAKYSNWRLSSWVSLSLFSRLSTVFSLSLSAISSLRICQIAVRLGRATAPTHLLI